MRFLLAYAICSIKFSKKRDAFSSLFHKDDFYTPLTKKDAGIYSDALEAVRLAPSSLNCQPWRVVLNDEGLHFYKTKNKYINKVAGLGNLLPILSTKPKKPLFLSSLFFIISPISIYT